jgi:hypothetical protein
VVLDHGHGPERVGHLERHDRVHAERDLVGGHDLLAGHVEHLLAQVHRHDLRAGNALPERVGARGQRRLVPTVAEEQAHVARLDRDRLDERGRAREGQDRGQLLVLEEGAARVHDVDAHVAHRRPQRVDARLQHELQAAVRPDDGPLVGLEVHHAHLAAETARLHHELQVRVDEPAAPDRHDLRPQAEERVEHPVDARLEDALERTVPEDERALVLEDLHTTQDHDDRPPLTSLCDT